MSRTSTLLLLLALASAAHAKVYKWVLPDGTVQYSDRAPVEGATPVEVPPLQTYTPPPLPPATRSPAPPSAGAGAGGYEAFAVASPRPDEAIRDNGGIVSISLHVEPALRPDHTIDIVMDGKVLGSGHATSVTLTNVDRGSHSVHAVIKSRDGAVVRQTASVTFHLLRASRLN